MPAQNPGDPSGMSAFGAGCTARGSGRPPRTPKYPPIANPYYDPNCDPNDRRRQQPVLRTRPDPGHTEHLGGHGSVQRHPGRQRHGLPEDHRGPEGVPLPHPQRGQRPLLEPAVVRRRPHHRHAAPRSRSSRPRSPPRRPTRSCSRRPTTTKSPEGPELDPDRHRGRFLPAPVVVPAQPTTWITDPTRFDVGNVDEHSLLLAPAERADVIVDFSQYAARP